MEVTRSCTIEHNLSLSSIKARDQEPLLRPTALLTESTGDHHDAVHKGSTYERERWWSAGLSVWVSGAVDLESLVMGAGMLLVTHAVEDRTCDVGV